VKRLVMLVVLAVALVAFLDGIGPIRWGQSGSRQLPRSHVVSPDSMAAAPFNLNVECLVNWQHHPNENYRFTITATAPADSIPGRRLTGLLMLGDITAVPVEATQDASSVAWTFTIADDAIGDATFSLLLLPIGDRHPLPGYPEWGLRLVEFAARARPCGPSN
jgi:hypothetical protein